MPAITKITINLIAQDFFSVWNFHLIIGTIVDKRVCIKCLKYYWTMFYYYKNSVVLEGFADVTIQFDRRTFCE